MINTHLTDRIRQYLSQFDQLTVEEKKMFGGLAFMVNDKMCVVASGDNLMCRVDPALQHELAQRPGYHPMIMKGRQLDGYCYISPEGYMAKKDFEYYVNLCLHFNSRAKRSKQRAAAKPK